MLILDDIIPFFFYQSLRVGEIAVFTIMSKGSTGFYIEMKTRV